MTRIRSFGIGCFHFATRRSVAEDFSPQSYIDDLRSFLETFPNISGIKITDYQSSNALGFGHDPNPDRLISDSKILPWPGSLQVSFSIFIADHSQKDLKGLFRNVDIGEKFKVDILYSGSFPVAFVTPDKADVLSPSAAIIAVREHFFENPKEATNIAFQCLGPSPFHADFFIELSEEKPEDFSLEIDERLGYDDVHIEIGKELVSSVESEEELFGIVADSFSKEIGLYYQIGGYRSKMIDTEIELSEKVERISNKVLSSQNVFRNDYRDTKKLLIEFLREKTDHEASIDGFGHMIEGLERSGHGSFSRYSRKELSDLTDTTFDSSIDVLKELSELSQTSWMGRNSVFSAVSGALFGGLVSLLVSISLSGTGSAVLSDDDTDDRPTISQE